MGFGYGFFKMWIGRVDGQFVKRVESYIPTTEDIYMMYDGKEVAERSDGLKYFIARFEGDPKDPKLYANKNGRMNTISEEEFFRELEKTKKEEEPKLAREDVENLNKLFKDLEISD